ncbi:methyltransferase (TIGR00027 family) [Streptomyces phaeochromogenes]|nr:methyltransferase (TIGR00027 family) [Streptomyces phaeochromogenes]
MTGGQERVQPSGVWATAVGVARVRALETERENALFRDPLAQAFAAAGGLWPSSPSLPGDEAARRRRLGVALSIVIRTKFLDGLLQRASESGVRQVVLLGAGMDSRAFRMDWPESTRLFEVDTAAPLDFKASVLRQERLNPDDIAALSPHRKDNVLRFGDYDTALLHIPPSPYGSVLNLRAEEG